MKASKKTATKPHARSKSAPGAKAVTKRKRTPARGSTGSKTKTKSKTKSTVKSIAKARTRARLQQLAPVVRVAVKPLEPQAKCGAGTSVQYLFRVDETVDGRTTIHLVFFDRHGWYCEHGRTCPAVGHARKYQGHIARAS